MENHRLHGVWLSMIFSLLFGMSGLASGVRAQTLPPFDAGDQLGVQPYQSYNAGNIDVIGLSTGTLSLNLPFLSYPQRGALKFSFNLIYNNEPQHVGKFCVPNSCNFEWGYTAPPGMPLPADQGDVQIAWEQNHVLRSLQVEYTTGGGINQYDYNFSVVDADGATHVLGNLGTYTSIADPPPSYYLQGTGPWRSLDASGWLANGALPNVGVSGGLQSLVGPDGVMYQVVGTGGTVIPEEDSNGNEITQTSTGWLDSLSRAIPSPPTSTSGIAGDPNLCPSTPVHVYKWTVPDAEGAGGQATYTFCYATVNLNEPPTSDSPFPYAGVVQSTKLQSIVLPNGQNWTFTYNDPGDGSTYEGSPVNYGTLTQINLPTGGTISYTYTTRNGYISGVFNEGRWVATRTVNANDGTGAHVWQYQYSTSGTPTTTMIDPLQNKTLHVFATYSQSDHSLYETQTQYLEGGATLKTVNTSYSSSTGSPNVNGGLTNVVPLTVTTVWPNYKTSERVMSYDSGFTYTGYAGTGSYPGIYGKQLTETDYDYGNGGPGPALRTTTTQYEAFISSSYLKNDLLDLPSSVTVAGGGITAQTDYVYDGSSPTASGAPQLNTGVGPPRGNATSITNCINASCSSSATTTKTYWDTGLPYQVTDPSGDKTTYQYSSAYADALPTTVTDPMQHATNYGYDLNTGLVTSITDPNQKITSFGYDSMWRIASAQYPDGGSATVTYQESTFPFSATVTWTINSSQGESKTGIFDGLGRVTESQITSDSQGTIHTDTTYDADGRVATVSNPYRSTSDATYGITTTAYDGIGRPLAVTKPDNSVVTTSYCDNSTKVTDESGKWRRSRVDGLGRLVEVDEPNSLAANVNACPAQGDAVWATTYSLDAMGNMTQVLQNGSRQRTFVYDSLSRLTRATNPESGAVNYTYYPDSQLETKQDARGITITYTLDADHRLKTKSYSNGDPTISYGYDSASCIGQGSCYNIGRRTSMADSAGWDSWSYDAMGRATGEQRKTNGVTEAFLYGYNYDGSVASIGYPSGRTVTYTEDNVGRPSTALDVANSVDYVEGSCGVSGGGACYAPQGALSSMILGDTGSFAGITMTDTYTNRLQPNEIKATNPTSTLMDLVYTFKESNGNNGNVLAVTNNLNSGRSQFFAYDQVNRLYVAQTNYTSGSDCFGNDYTYDAWGNLSATPEISSPDYTCSSWTNLNVIINGNNQISATGISYDPSGNMTSDGINSYVWNGEGQMKTADSITYTYDGDGKRIMKSNGKIYWYGLSSEPLTESDTSGNFTDEYVFFGGARVAHRVVSGNSIYYYVQDHLGTSRMMLTSTGTACYDADFAPFGTELVVTNTCAQNYKFTGKERDPETGLDNLGARYNSSNFGRFMSPDPLGGHLEDPQTLNRYNYVRNNPLRYTDPTGLDFYLSCGKASSTCAWQTVGYDKDGNVIAEALVQGVTNADHSFTPTQISNDADGNLVDKNGNQYNAMVGPSGVTFTQAGADSPASSSGVFVNGTGPTAIQGSGDLAGFSFTFTNSKLEANQTAAGTFTFSGTPDEAGAALERAGFAYHLIGENAGMSEYRSPGSFFTGANSGHFNVYEINLNPNRSVPQAQGDMHFGEHNPFNPIGLIAHCVSDGAC